ncbi:hypothetical protein AB832_08115 [Flavobacteriaceae bacterium (ex Bugula neritina AB1)]|nr:hypothetical protein AB832_08115 [Flavobacteriaceae bacterium (ex Bugula neritina AB1)]
MPTPFTKENQPTRRRGKAKKTLALDAIRKISGSEQNYYENVVELSVMGEGNPALISQLLQRIDPPIKATLPKINFEFDVTLKPHEQVLQIVKATADGEIIPEAAQILINGITSVMKVKEVTELEDRIKQLEGMAGVNDE